MESEKAAQWVDGRRGWTVIEEAEHRAVLVNLKTMTDRIEKLEMQGRIERMKQKIDGVNDSIKDFRDRIEKLEMQQELTRQFLVRMIGKAEELRRNLPI